MHKLICAFPTLGKTTTTMNSLYPGEFVDLELGELANALYHHKVQDFDKRSIEFQTLLRVYETAIQAHIQTSTVFIAWPQYSARMLKKYDGVILLPSYSLTELIERLRRRGSSPAFVYEMNFHLEEYLNQWVQVAADAGIKVEYANSVQEFLNRCCNPQPRKE